MLAVGYNEPRQVFVVRNSWGANWVRETERFHLSSADSIFDSFRILSTYDRASKGTVSFPMIT
jgi:hypothetical protein